MIEEFWSKKIKGEQVQLFLVDACRWLIIISLIIVYHLSSS